MQSLVAAHLVEWLKDGVVLIGGDAAASIRH